MIKKFISGKNRKNSYKIIVTGATGFVGKVLIKKLVKKYGHKDLLCLVYNNDSEMEVAGRKAIEKLGVKYVKVDLTDANTLTDLPIKPRLVIHLAAETDTSKYDHKVNSVGVINLYKAFGKLTQSTHFIHIGTMVEVVGRPNCKEPIDENSKDYPTNEYTRTKLNGEQFISKKCLVDKFRLTVIRPNTIYGMGVRKNSLFDMVRNMVSKRSIITRINWPGRSALIHVEDLTDVIIRFTEKPPFPGKVQKYLAYSENLSIFEISKIIHKNLKLKFRPIIIYYPVWNLIRSTRKFIPLLEYILPYSLYNYFWRLGIIIDDVVWCKSKKLFSTFPNFKPKKFLQKVTDIV